MSDRVRARVVVSGMVQGVFFRQEMSERARTRRVDGWVRNLPGGGVEAVFEGSRDQVDSMIRWCREGPRLARVDSVDVGWEEPLGEPRFSIRW